MTIPNPGSSGGSYIYLPDQRNGIRGADKRFRFRPRIREIPVPLIGDPGAEKCWRGGILKLAGPIKIRPISGRGSGF